MWLQSKLGCRRWWPWLHGLLLAALHRVSRDDLQWTHRANAFHKSATRKPQIQCRIGMNPQNHLASNQAIKQSSNQAIKQSSNQATQAPCRKRRASFVQQTRRYTRRQHVSKYALLRCCSPSSVHQQVHGNHFETRSSAKKF